MKFPNVHCLASLSAVMLALVAPPIATLHAADTPLFTQDFEADDLTSQAPRGYVTEDLGDSSTRSYEKGIGVDGSEAMAMVAEFAAQNGQSHAALQYEISELSGNDSTELKDYYLQFDAKGSKPSATIQVFFLGKRAAFFGGEDTGSLSTSVILPETADTFQTYRIALNDPSVSGDLDPTGKTLQLTWQIISADWGGGQGNKIIIDNIKFGTTTGK